MRDAGEYRGVDLADEAASCTSAGAQPVDSLPVRGGVISDGFIYVMTYAPEDRSMNARWEVATAVVAVEDRVLVMTRQRGVQDYVLPTSLQTSAFNAAHRMVGVTAPAESSADPSAPASPNSTSPETTSGSPAGSASPGGTPSGAALSASNLLTSADAIYPNGALDWVESSTASRETTPAANACWQGSMTARGARATVQRDFVLVTMEGGDSDADARMNETVAEFATEAEAQKAYEDVLTWFDGCSPKGSTSYRSNPFESVSLPGQAEGVTGLAIYGPITAAPGTAYDPADQDGAGWFLEMGVVHDGDRVAIVSHLIGGLDYNWPAEDGGTPVQRMLPVAADRLASR